MLSSRPGLQVEERIVSIRKQGLNLRAIESCLQGCPGAKPIILFLPSGLKYSVGPHRIFVEFSRRLAMEGFICYRFDPGGLGLSDGEFGCGPIYELWNRIEDGCLVDDSAFFIDNIRKKWPGRKIIACGLCGGAITAALLARTHGHLIDGLISINTEVFRSSADSLPPGSETSTHVDLVMKKYATKIVSRDAWSRLLRMESDIKGILRFTGRFILQCFRRNKKRLHEYRNINHHLVSAFRSIGHNETSHLMLFSEHSSSWHKFQGTFLPLLLDSRYDSPCGEIKVIQGASHEFHSQVHREEALQHIREWLNENFAGREHQMPLYDTRRASNSPE